MKQITKGALAIGGAGVLLLGGAGTLAYWTESADVTGGGLESGHLEVTANTCGSADWLLADGTTDATAALLVPGDVITKTCSFTVGGEGDNFEDVAITIAAPNWTTSSDAGLVSALGTVSAVYEDADGASVASGDDLALGTVVNAEISMTFATSTTGDVAEDAVASLDDIAITLTQNPAS